MRWVHTLRGPFLAAASLAPMLGTFVAVRTFGRHTGIASIGYLASLQAVAAVATLVADLNVGPAGIRRLAQAQPGQRDPITRQLRTVTLIGACIVSMVAVVVSPVVGQVLLGPRAVWWSFAAAIASGALAMCGAQELNILTGVGKVWTVAAILVGQGCVGLVCALTVLNWSVGRPAEQYLLATAVAQMFVAVTISRFAQRKLQTSPRPSVARTRANSWREIQLLLEGSGTTTVAVLLGAGSFSLAPLVVQRAGGYEASGSFRVASMVASVCAAAFAPVIARVWFPLAASLPGSSVLPAARRQVRQAMLAALAVVAVAIALAPWLSRFLTGTTTETQTMRVRLGAEIARAAALVYAYAVLARLPARSYLRIECWSAVLMITGTFVGTRVDGAVGASVGFGVAVVCYWAIASSVVHAHLAEGRQGSARARVAESTSHAY